ncbi:MAG: hypothetical protein RL539_357 [Pseudomonadota bacterium]
MQAFSSPTSSAMPLPDMPFSAAKASTPSLAGADAELELDVAVIGASVAGLLTAQGLARLGYRCALIGPDPVSTRKVPGFDPRIFALSPASWRWLQQQGLAAAIDESRLGLIERMQLEAPGLSAKSAIVLDAYKAAVDQLALTLEQSELIAAGQQALAMTQAFRFKDALVSLEADAGDARSLRRRIQLESGQRIRAKLLIGCDGAHSALRQLAGIKSREIDYQSAAVVANFSIDHHHRHTAFQWFGQQGILALLPLPGEAMSMVWSAPRPLAQSLMALDPDALCHKVQSHIESCSSDAPRLLNCISSPASFPLLDRISDPPCSHRLVLLADAAHVVHPMAGQGLNLGIGDIIELLDVLSSPAARHDPGVRSVLERYARRRAEPVLAMSILTRTLQQTFREPLPQYVGGLARWAWSRLAGSSWLQSAMIHHASRHGPGR